jgi:hypothetical protein
MPPAFVFELTRADQTALLVTVIVVPQPIPGINVQQESQPLTDAQVSTWTRDWGAHVERLDDLRSAGRAYTPAERTAADDSSKPLGASDLVPLALLHAGTPSDRPILVSRSNCRARPSHDGFDEPCCSSGVSHPVH